MPLISTLSNEFFTASLIAVLWTNWTTTNGIYPLQRVVLPPLNEPAAVINYGLPRTQQYGTLYSNYYVQVIHEEQNRLFKIDTIKVTDMLVIRTIGPLYREQIMEPDVQSFYWTIPNLQGIPAPIPPPDPETLPPVDVDPVPSVLPTTLEVPVPDQLRRELRKEIK